MALSVWCPEPVARLDVPQLRRAQAMSNPPMGEQLMGSRRLTPTERLHEVTMAAIQRAAAPPEHTVGLTLNAKGDVQIEVTGRGPDLAGLVESVSAQFDSLCAKYPRGNGDTAKPVKK